MKQWIMVFSLMLLTACTDRPHRFTVEVINGYTPVKDRGDSPNDWLYAMLATIETEHIGRGDSVNLSALFIERGARKDNFKEKLKGERALHLIQTYGLVPFDAMPPDYDPPHYAFMDGCQYTPQEFARSVCSPNEYRVLKHSRIPASKLLTEAELAVRAHRGVCWEARKRCLSIIGIAHDEQAKKYFIMKDSRGEDYGDQGLVYVAFDTFLKETVAIYISTY